MPQLRIGQIRKQGRIIQEKANLPPQPPRPPVGNFRPITPDPWSVVIPPVTQIRRKKKNATRVVRQKMTKYLLSMPQQEKEELERVAFELCISLGTLIRLAYKRFIRMPEPPLSQKQYTAHQMGIQRDVRALARQVRRVIKGDMAREAEAGMAALDEKDRLSTKHLEHKLIEVVANIPYRKTKRMAFDPGLRAETVGNPEGKNGNSTAGRFARRLPADRPGPDHVRGVGGNPDDSVAELPTPAAPRRRLMIKKPKETS